MLTKQHRLHACCSKDNKAVIRNTNRSTIPALTETITLMHIIRKCVTVAELQCVIQYEAVYIDECCLLYTTSQTCATGCKQHNYCLELWLKIRRTENHTNQIKRHRLAITYSTQGNISIPVYCCSTKQKSNACKSNRLRYCKHRAKLQIC